ncbi:MAG: MATE family efflux transporter, partial [Oscillospiraceae bacterium]
TFAIMPMVNLSNAMSTFTAQNIGAGKKERVAEGYHTSLMILAVVCLVITGSLYIWGDGMMGLFVDANSSANVIEVGLEYLHVVSLFYIVMGIMFTTNGLLRGSGDVIAFTATTVVNISVRIAFAYLMTPIIGAKSIWWSIVVAWFTGLIICYARYRSGAWKHKGVVHKADMEY